MFVSDKTAVILCPTPDAYGMGVEVSPLHAHRFKSAVPCPSPTFHVSDAMFAESPPDLASRGVKRKADSLLEDDDDEEEEDEDDAASTSSSSTSSGSAGDVDFRSYVRRRHAIFNLSLFKLSRFRQAPDPSLLRSVLVCNTLRALERDCVPAPPPVQRTSSPAPPSGPPLPHCSPTPYHPYDCPAPVDYQVGDFDNGRLTPFVRCEPWSEDDRLPSLNWSSVLNFGNSSPPPPPPPASELPTYTLLPGGTASTSPVMSPATSSSSGDEIFGDIDLSLYDFDLLSPLSPPGVKPAAVVSADDRTSCSESVVATSAAGSCQLSSGQQQVNFCYKTLGDITTVMS